MFIRCAYEVFDLKRWGTSSLYFILLFVYGIISRISSAITVSVIVIITTTVPTAPLGKKREGWDFFYETIDVWKPYD